MVAAARIQSVPGAAGERVLSIAGRLDAESTGRVWREALALAEARRPTPSAAAGRRSDGSAAALVVDAAGLEYCDGAGVALLAALREREEAAGGRFELRGLRPDLRNLLDLLQPAAQRPAADLAPAAPSSWIAALGRAVLQLEQDARGLVAFVGELVIFLGQLLRHPRRLRLRDVMSVADRAGLGATPIVLLVGFLLGLILAFQGAIPMQRFGAQIFVADLLGISMLRELGGLMASILLAARSGSAFAAEIGTMKVNEEIDALTTMGIEPVRFLVVPRVIAAILVVPALAMLTNLAGLVGGAVVFRSLGFPLVTYVSRIAESVTAGDVLGGLFKAMVFGVIVAGIGCQRGLQTGQGAGAVGESTTSSVVSAIILIAVADGIFSVVFYILGI